MRNAAGSQGMYSSTRPAAPRPASDKQLQWIKKVGPTKQITDPVILGIIERAVKGEPVMSRNASMALDVIFAAPDLPRADAATEPGIYYLDGQVIRTKTSQAGRLYAMQLNLIKVSLIKGKASTWKYEYTRGLINRLTPAHRLTEEQAEQLGQYYGICVICGRELSAKESVRRSIGPVCIKRLG